MFVKQREIKNLKKLKKMNEKEKIVVEPMRFEKAQNLDQLLMARKSSRNFIDSALTQSELGTILNAAKGVNRQDPTEERPFIGFTVPSAMHLSFIDLYVFTKDGIFKWVPEGYLCEVILKKDCRELTGKQEFVSKAAVNIVMVANYSKPEIVTSQMSTSDKKLYAAVEAGAVSQNIYLACAALGLGTVVRASFDNGSIINALKIEKGMNEVILAQSIGRVLENMEQ